MTRRFAAVGLVVAVSMIASVGLLLLTGAHPGSALEALVGGSVGSVGKLSDTVMAWTPIALAAAGLVVTYTAGLWNIGVEGQMIAGAIAASAVARSASSALAIPASLLLGLIGGGIWGLLAGLLRVRGGVNEIFGGLGLGFVAQSVATYLVIGPWKRAGVASTSGTEPFPDAAWLSTIGGTRLAPLAVVLALAAVGVVWYIIARTRLGLELRAVGSNLRSARILGIPAERTMLTAFAVSGGLAGVAGGVVVLGIQHKLVPAVSGGRGFLAILVVLLAGFGIRWVVPIALFFAAISVGSSQLVLRLGLDSSLGGVLQGVVVLVAVLVGGWRDRRGRGSG